MNTARNTIQDGFAPVKFTERQIRNFWRRVRVSENPEDCWIWIGRKNAQGYGQLDIGDKNMNAHRVSWMIHNGLQIPIGKSRHDHCVIHNCPNGDNPACVNPSHLKIATQKENVHDMLRKNRGNYANGERVNTCRVSRNQVDEILRMYCDGTLNQRAYARKIGVHFQTINNIVRRKTWLHI